jgi:hypothetical protein
MHARIISDEGKPLTTVIRRDNGGVYLAQAGKAYVNLSHSELRRLFDFTRANGH